jgi:predicted nucleic acid-binding protein
MPTSNVFRRAPRLAMYLIDTNVISEGRKKAKANNGVVRFFEAADAAEETVYLSAISVGELRRGLELIRHRGDSDQASRLEAWLTGILTGYRDNISDFGAEAAQIWGRLRVPNPGQEIGKQIAAIALVNDLTVVTRNLSDFRGTGARLLNPFTPE